MNRSN